MRWSVLAVLVLTAGSAIADSDPTAAIAAADQAQKLAAAGKYDDAAAKFGEAFSLDPRAEYLCNVGVAYQRAKRLPKAQIYLAECLRRGGDFDTAFVSTIRKGLEVVETKLRQSDFTPIDIVVEPRSALVRIDDDPLGEALVGSRLVYVPFGHHTLLVSATGYRDERRDIDAVTRSQRQVRIELAPVPAPAPAPAPARPAAPAMAKTVTTTTSRSRVPAVFATVLTAAIGGGAVVAYVHARTVMNRADSSTIDRTMYDDYVVSSRTWQHASWALAGGAAVGVVVSALLWQRSGTHVEVTSTAGGTAVSWAGSW